MAKSKNKEDHFEMKKDLDVSKIVVYGLCVDPHVNKTMV